MTASLIELGRELWGGWDAGRGGAHETRSFTTDAARRRLFFAVRRLAGDAPRMQYAFVDAEGAVRINAVTGARDPAAVEPWDLEARLEDLCDGADLIAHHRVLQAGLLPRACVAAAARVDCAARTFERFARRRGLRPAAGEQLRLDQCLAFIGLPPVEGEDAVMQALSVRLLWRWMDTED